MATRFYLALSADRSVAETYSTEGAARGLVGATSWATTVWRVFMDPGCTTAQMVDVTEWMAMSWWREAVDARLIRAGEGDIDMVPLAYRETLAAELAASLGSARGGSMNAPMTPTIAVRIDVDRMLHVSTSDGQAVICGLSPEGIDMAILLTTEVDIRPMIAAAVDVHARMNGADCIPVEVVDHLARLQVEAA